MHAYDIVCVSVGGSGVGDQQPTEHPQRGRNHHETSQAYGDRCRVRVLSHEAVRSGSLYAGPGRLRLTGPGEAGAGAGRYLPVFGGAAGPRARGRRTEPAPTSQRKGGQWPAFVFPRLLFFGFFYSVHLSYLQIRDIRLSIILSKD